MWSSSSCCCNSIPTNCLNIFILSQIDDLRRIQNLFFSVNFPMLHFYYIGLLLWSFHVDDPGWMNTQSYYYHSVVFFYNIIVCSRRRICRKPINNHINHNVCMYIYISEHLQRPSIFYCTASSIDRWDTIFTITLLQLPKQTTFLNNIIFSVQKQESTTDAVTCLTDIYILSYASNFNMCYKK